MKETVIDVLMYLFQNYIDGDLEIGSDRETLKGELTRAGFPHAEINKAFHWLEGLSITHDGILKKPEPAAQSTRIYTVPELRKLNLECRGFMLYLEQNGIVDTTTRELVIDRVMALESPEISLDQLKWIVLMVLFNQPGQEASIAWMEDLFFEESVASVH